MKIRPCVDRFEFERALLEQGLELIAGIDEAGRGPLAGPVMAAAVMLPKDWIGSRLPSDLEGLNDSKQLTQGQRERFFDFLTHCPEVRWGIADSPVESIDAINILQATHQAMNRALACLNPAPQHALVDGLRVASLACPQTAVVKGDARSYSIAAASVLAKVTRDRLMVEMDRMYPGYGFALHKGYGTARHLAALEKLGPCHIHRRSFLPRQLNQPELF